MGVFGEGIIERLHPLSPLRDEKSDGYAFVVNTFGAWLDWFDENIDYSQLFVQFATGKMLDLHGKERGVVRNEGESDDEYRSRMLFEKGMHNSISELKTSGIMFWDYIYNIGGGSKLLYLKLYDKDTNPIANKEVDITIYDLINDTTSTYTQNTDINGVVKFNFAIPSYNYRINVSSDATSTYNQLYLDFSNAGSYISNKKDTILFINDINIAKGNPLRCRLLTTDGNPIQGARVNFDIYENLIYEKNTDVNGEVSLQINLQNVTKSDIRIYFNGNADYNPTETKFTFNILNQEDNLQNINVDCGYQTDIHSTQLTSKNTYISNTYIAHANWKTQEYMAKKFLLNEVKIWI